MERKETMIENVSNHIQTVRLLTIQSLDKINPAFISTVPKGFNNNIHWNFGHIAYIQERLVFELTGERMGIGSEYETFFAAGTAPHLWQGNPPSILEIKGVLQEQTERVISVTKNKFTKTLPTPFTNKMGITFQTVGECILFSTFHEGMHLETIKRIYKSTKNK
ncbi:DinB family protein [Cytobacillus sp. FSL W7-1323]|uniref:DinB family protein n=1 Tax=Cytobacillus TaxID=2675230 RepID=UPI00277E2DCB|nr:DinB family protein [Cytobacillus kochii]MDQ0184365.1 hypothetical protein [Cytobacillus kochii]MED1604664.1 DinB family protein [Cytobacillus kochii]